MLTLLSHDVWHEPLLAAPGLGAWLMGRGGQRLPRFILGHYAAVDDAFSPEDVELFLAPFRDPARARAASALYRNYIAPTVMRILTGGYRREGRRLITPTRIGFGSEDRIFSQPGIYGGHEQYADDLGLLDPVPGAAHFVADERPDVVVEQALELFARA